MYLQDLSFNFDKFTEHTDNTLFESELYPLRPYEYGDVIMAISLGVSRDKRVIERSLFTLLDLLAAVGGLQTILAYIATSILFIWTRGRLLDTYLSKELFKSSQVSVATQKRWRGYCHRIRSMHLLAD